MTCHHALTGSASADPSLGNPNYLLLLEGLAYLLQVGCGEGRLWGVFFLTPNCILTTTNKTQVVRSKTRCFQRILFPHWLIFKI